MEQTIVIDKCSFHFSHMLLPPVSRCLDGWLAILHPFQQYFSHIRMMVVRERKAVCNASNALKRQHFAIKPIVLRKAGIIFKVQQGYN